jgi:hypothetical protein
LIDEAGYRFPEKAGITRYGENAGSSSSTGWSFREWVTESCGRAGNTDSQVFQASGVGHGRQEHQESGDDDGRHKDYAGEVSLAGCHGFPPDPVRCIFFQTDMLYAQTGAGVNKYF